jgi:hypothetical protein
MTTPNPTGRPTDRLSPTLPLACSDASLSPTTVEPSTTALPRGHAQRLRARLGDRDLAVLSSLHTLRLATGEQLRRLHVADGSPATQSRRCRALLQRLTDLRLVNRLGRRVGGVHAGSDGFVYGLSGHGQAVLAVDGPLGGRRRRVWDTSPSFQDHVLSVASLYVGLVEAERAGQLELLAFDAEPGAWRRHPGSGGQTVTLKPDGYVQLGVGDIEHSAFIEVDCGTESGPTIARKCRMYGDYWRTGIEQTTNEVFPRVLWLGTTERSVQRIAGVLAKLPADTRHLFQVVPIDEAIPALTSTALGGRME